MACYNMHLGWGRGIWFATFNFVQLELTAGSSQAQACKGGNKGSLSSKRAKRKMRQKKKKYDPPHTNPSHIIFSLTLNQVSDMNTLVDS